MKTLENSSETLSLKIPKWLIYSFIGISFIGFLDATYLTAEHYSGAGLNCIIFTGCDTVTTSSYNEMLGLPVALYGAVYYFGILLISLLYIDNPNRKFVSIFKLLSPKFIPVYTLIGFIMSARFVYLMLFVINAICTYCLLSAITSTLLFILGITLLKNRFYKEAI